MAEIPESPTPDTQGLGKVMVICAWVLALLLLMLFFNHWSNKNLMNTDVKMITVNGIPETILKRNAQNQYMAKGQINGKPVIFLLDTGATDVVIPEKLAKLLNIDHGQESFASTAAGNVKVYQARIDELIIGNIILKNISASISPTIGGEEVLLGMSALKKITFYQQGDNLILTVTNH